MKPNIAIFDISSNLCRNYFKFKSGDGTGRFVLDGVDVGPAKNTLHQMFNEMGENESQRGGFSNLVIVLDHDGDNFRHDIYPEYKANRPPKEHDYLVQKRVLRESIRLLGLYLIEMPGVESDDVIGTIATKTTNSGCQSTIFTGDKDTFAFVDENTRVYSGKEKKLYDVNGVIESKGVHPERIQDYLTLVGDKVDNIDGVKGVGDKSAGVILNTYSLDQVLDNPDIIDSLELRGKSKIIDSIKNSKDSIALMRQLVDIKTDLKLGCSLSQWSRNLAPEYQNDNNVVFGAVTRAIANLQS